MQFSIERVTENIQLGEGPHWDVNTQTLFFVDIKSGTIHKYKPSTDECAKATVGKSPSFIIPIEGTTNKFLIGLLKNIAIVTWDGASSDISNIEIIADVDTKAETQHNRLNDGKVDPTGTRLWTGTLNNEGHPLNKKFPQTGSILSFNSNLKIKYHIDKIWISNGLAWTEDSKYFYYIDSLKKTVDQFDYDAIKESISNRKTIFTLEKHNIDGYPDGQTIDTDGNLWVAIFNGSKIIKINPRVPETLLQTIEMPAKQVTSVAFGGQYLDELYVTTAHNPADAVAPLTSMDGVTYKITGLNVKGFGGVPFRFE